MKTNTICVLLLLATGCSTTSALQSDEIDARTSTVTGVEFEATYYCFTRWGEIFRQWVASGGRVRATAVDTRATALQNGAPTMLGNILQSAWREKTKERRIDSFMAAAEPYLPIDCTAPATAGTVLLSVDGVVTDEVLEQWRQRAPEGVRNSGSNQALGIWVFDEIIGPDQ